MESDCYRVKTAKSRCNGDENDGEQNHSVNNAEKVAVPVQVCKNMTDSMETLTSQQENLVWAHSKLSQALKRIK